MRSVRSAFCLLLLLSATACGGESRTTAEPTASGRWFTARLEGVRGASGIAVLGKWILVAAGEGDREIHLVERAALVPGAVIRATSIPIEVEEDVHLTGGEDFATRGYRIRDLWGPDVDFQGLAVQSPDHVFLAERTYHVVYVGRLTKTASGSFRRLHLHRVFLVPGAVRPGADASDWRDTGPGLAGLTAVEGRRRTEDLYVAERGGEEAGAFRIHKLDRFGMGLAWFTVDLGTPANADVGGLSWEDGRYLVLHGSDRGALSPVREGRWGARIEAGQPVPAAVPVDAEVWRGLAHAPDGTIYLVSGGERPVLAWRR